VGHPSADAPDHTELQRHKFETIPVPVAVRPAQGTRSLVGADRIDPRMARSGTRAAPDPCLCSVCAERGVGGFHVMEVWIENTGMVELLTPAFAIEYLTLTRRRGAHGA
jgi:hypothetical protein